MEIIALHLLVSTYAGCCHGTDGSCIHWWECTQDVAMELMALYPLVRMYTGCTSGSNHIVYHLWTHQYMNIICDLLRMTFSAHAWGQGQSMSSWNVWMYYSCLSLNSIVESLLPAWVCSICST